MNAHLAEMEKDKDRNFGLRKGQTFRVVDVAVLLGSSADREVWKDE